MVARSDTLARVGRCQVFCVEGQKQPGGAVFVSGDAYNNGTGRDAGVDERGCLESICTRKGTGGSNPSLAAKKSKYRATQIITTLCH